MKARVALGKALEIPGYALFLFILHAGGKVVMSAPGAIQLFAASVALILTGAWLTGD